MWAQLITMRLKPGHDEGLTRLLDQLQSAEPTGSGLIRALAMRDQNDPSRIYHLAVFESEEQARARESDPDRSAGLAEVRATMAEIFDGPPEFVDLEVTEELTA